MKSRRPVNSDVGSLLPIAMTRIIVVLILSAVAGVVLFFGAAMADGMCHCMDSMFTLFPYGSFVMMHFSSDTFGLPLALLQFPVYAVLLTLVKGMRWKLTVALLLVVFHVLFATFALRDYRQSRRASSLRRDPTTRWTGAAGACFASSVCGEG